jgi:hypothetical protein
MNIKLLFGRGVREAVMSGRKRRRELRQSILFLAILSRLIYIANATAAPPMDKNFYLPDAKASKVVSVTKEGKPAAEVIVLTEAIAIK